MTNEVHRYQGHEGSYLANCQSNLVIVLDAQSLLVFIFTNTTAYHWADVSCCTPCQVHVSLTFTNPEIIDLELQPKFDCKFLHQRGKFHNLRPNGHNYDEKVSFTLSLTNPYLEVYGLIECSLSLSLSKTYKSSLFSFSL